jgi:hypothetical protein
MWSAPTHDTYLRPVIQYLHLIVGVAEVFQTLVYVTDRICGLVVRVLDYRCRGYRVRFPGTTKKKVVGLERGPLSLVSTTEELLDRKVAAPV